MTDSRLDPTEPLDVSLATPIAHKTTLQLLLNELNLTTKETFPLNKKSKTAVTVYRLCKQHTKKDAKQIFLVRKILHKIKNELNYLLNKNIFKTLV